MKTQNKRLIGILATIAFILLIPLTAMQFTDEVNWDLADFVIAATLLLIIGLIWELVMRKVNKKETRIVFRILIIVILLLIWAELAVGIFGTPLAGS